jgi:hypothetical protein
LELSMPAQDKSIKANALFVVLVLTVFAVIYSVGGVLLASMLLAFSLHTGLIPVVAILCALLMGAGLGWMCGEACWAAVMDRPGHQPTLADRRGAAMVGGVLGVASLAIVPIPFIFLGLWMLPPLMLTEGIGAGDAARALWGAMRQRPGAFLLAGGALALPVKLCFAYSLFMLYDSRQPSSGGVGISAQGAALMLAWMSGVVASGVATLYCIPAMSIIYRKLAPRRPLAAQETPA